MRQLLNVVSTGVWDIFVLVQGDSKVAQSPVLGKDGQDSFLFSLEANGVDTQHQNVLCQPPGLQIFLNANTVRPPAGGVLGTMTLGCPRPANRT